MKKGQTTIEYIMLLGAAILFVTIVVLIVRGSVFASSMKNAGNDIGNLKGNLSQVSATTYAGGSATPVPSAAPTPSPSLVS